MKENNKSLRGYVLGLVSVIIVVATIGMFFWKLAGGATSEDKYLSSPQTILQPNGFYVYYPVSAYFRRNELVIETQKEQYVAVADIEKNLIVTVNPEWNGTVLIVKHWQDKIGDVADSAELVVRTEEYKARWERVIEEALKKHEKEPSPQDILPPPLFE